MAQLKFRLDHEIGLEGKNSQVFKGEDPQLKATLAFKRIQKKNFTDANEYFSEASLLYQGGHTNIVPIHYACEDPDYIYLAMPFYSRGSLKTRMASGHLTNREIITIATQFLSGLHHIHSKRMIHFDLKPDNILFSERGDALISDFGLAKQTSYSGTADQDRMYGKMAPPEAYSTGTFTQAFDIYQAGLTLHRMCVGDNEFYNDFGQYSNSGGFDRAAFIFAVRNGKFPRKTGYLEHTPPALVKAISRCLQSDITTRTKSALDIVNEISAIDGELLDWRYSLEKTGRTWIKQTDEYTIKLNVDSTGKSEAVKTKVGGTGRRLTAYCLPLITSSEVKKFLKTE